jgi:hypothetical protein
MAMTPTSRIILPTRLALLLAVLAPVCLLVTGGFGQSSRAAGDPELPRVCVDTSSVPPTGRTIAVDARGDFQAALRRAQPGDVITLEAGARFTGNFTLPNKMGTGWIIIRTSAPDSSLPAPGTRITPASASVLPKVVSPNSRPVLTAAPGAHHYRFIGVEFTVAPDVATNHGLILLGNRPASPDQLPHDLIFERVYIHGTAQVNLRRGIALNSASTAIIDSYISDVHEVGADSQAIGGWDGPGPFRIVNNRLEGAGENVMFGGADPSIQDLVPSDIEIRRNHFFKPLTWRTEDPSYAGRPWTVKNLLELKNARRVLIDGNLFENNWAHAQAGTAVVFTVRNQDGTAPWSAVEDVTFTNNIVRHTGAGVGMHGIDSKPSQPSKRMLIRNNLFEDVSGARWGGGGRLFQAYNGITDLVIEHNTAFQDGPIIMAEGRPHTGFVYRHNLTPHNDYGIQGTGTGPGHQTLHAYFPGAVVEKNVLIANPDASRYPANNFHSPSLGAVGFVDHARGDYRLTKRSPYARAGSDGKDIGVDFEALSAAMTAASEPDAGRDSCVRGGKAGQSPVRR